jgi:hypothetical protein
MSLAKSHILKTIAETRLPPVAMFDRRVADERKPLILTTTLPIITPSSMRDDDIAAEFLLLNETSATATAEDHVRCNTFLLPS